MFKKIVSYIKNEGLLKFLFFSLHKIINHRKAFSMKYISGNGIEIGAFGNPLFVDKKNTIVQYVDYLPPEKIKEIILAVGDEHPVKIDYCCKADDLSKIKNETQDFIIANHVFEHLANPIKAIVEWNRVLKTDGILFLTVPDKRRTFDIGRNRTTLEHMILDFTDPSPERDFEHYLEFAQITRPVFDSSLDTKKQIENEAHRLIDIDYSIHYHVFLEEDVVSLFDWCTKNTSSSLKLIDIKHTTWNPADNEFIIIFKKK